MQAGGEGKPSDNVYNIISINIYIYIKGSNNPPNSPENVNRFTVGRPKEERERASLSKLSRLLDVW